MGQVAEQGLRSSFGEGRVVDGTIQFQDRDAGAQVRAEGLVEARSAAGSWKGPPGAPIMLPPRNGRSTVTGPVERLSLPARMRPSSRFSSGVVRMSVICGLC